ncbi:MAG: hypothetical protein JXQ27_16125 [Acidobacteria bacterium]|nr:hypothetical protein [Acidobacteriota bacterium]
MKDEEKKMNAERGSLRQDNIFQETCTTGPGVTTISEPGGIGRYDPADPSEATLSAPGSDSDP